MEETKITPARLRRIADQMEFLLTGKLVSAGTRLMPQELRDYATELERIQEVKNGNREG